MQNADVLKTYKSDPLGNKTQQFRNIFDDQNQSTAENSHNKPKFEQEAIPS